MRTLKGELRESKIESLIKEWTGVVIEGDYSWEHYYPGKVIEEIFNYNTEVVPGEPSDPYIYPVEELRYNLLTGDKEIGGYTESAYESDNMYFSLIWRWVSTLRRAGLLK